jgi:phage-related baseplate assembly protein
VAAIPNITELDVAGLPAPDIVEPLDVQAIRAALISNFSGAYPEFTAQLLESDPAIKLLEVCAYREFVLRARLNDVARANLVAFATGSDLDHLAAFYDVTRMTSELDDRLRTRLILAIAGRSTGGTMERYKFIAMSADVRIKDVAVWCASNSPLIHVSVLNSLNAGVPYTEMLTAVEEAVNDLSVKMVNDTLLVESAVSTTVNVVADVWLLPQTPVSVFDALEGNVRADWDREGGLGRDLSRSWVTRALMRPGIAKIALITPASGTIVDPHQAVSLGTLTLNNKGRDF